MKPSDLLPVQRVGKLWIKPKPHYRWSHDMQHWGLRSVDGAWPPWVRHTYPRFLYTENSL